MSEEAHLKSDLLELSLSFWEHLSELRQVIFKCLFVIVLGMFAALFFYQEILTFLNTPLKTLTWSSPSQTIDPNLVHQKIQKERLVNSGQQESTVQLSDQHFILSQSHNVHLLKHNTFLIPPGGYLEYEKILSVPERPPLMLLGPLEGMSIAFKMSFWVGLVGTSPLWLFFMLGYIAPALRVREQHLLFPFLLLSLIFLSTGLLLAFFVTIPLANQYLIAFNYTIGDNLWSLSSYFDYTFMLLLANALAFELGVVLIFLVHFGILTEKILRSNRHYAIVAAFIIAAVLTPPDVLTQFMLAIPLIALYESAIWYAKFQTIQFFKKNEKRT